MSAFADQLRVILSEELGHEIGPLKRYRPSLIQVDAGAIRWSAEQVGDERWIESQDTMEECVRAHRHEKLSLKRYPKHIVVSVQA